MLCLYSAETEGGKGRGHKGRRVREQGRKEGRKEGRKDRPEFATYADKLAVHITWAVLMVIDPWFITYLHLFHLVLLCW